MLDSDEGREDWGAENMHILWIILIGFIAGVIAKLVTPGENEPKGFILTTTLGIDYRCFRRDLPRTGYRLVWP
jgi:hypothetical protein